VPKKNTVDCCVLVLAAPWPWCLERHLGFLPSLSEASPPILQKRGRILCALRREREREERERRESEKREREERAEASPPKKEGENSDAL
jgi:hypothetical protein